MNCFLIKRYDNIKSKAKKDREIKEIRKITGMADIYYIRQIVWTTQFDIQKTCVSRAFCSSS